MTKARPDTKAMLDGASKGDEQALAALMPIVYDELRRLAASYMRRERPGQTLQPTALVHDVYIRLLGDTGLSWQNRAHFFGIAAQLMRRILVDYARSRGSEKHGGEQIHLALDDALDEAAARDADLVALDDALTSLAALDPQQSRIIELRYFGGLTIEETAEALGISDTTVEREWRMARAWLLRELSK